MATGAAHLDTLRSRLRTFLLGPQLLAFFPAVTLAAFWIGGEAALVTVALVTPLLFALSGVLSSGSPALVDPATGLILRSSAVDAADRFVSKATAGCETTAALVIGIDDFAGLSQRLDPRATDHVLASCANRITSDLRRGDVVARLEGPRFAVILSPDSRATLDTLVQIAARIQRDLEEPVIVDGARIYVSASIGFCGVKSAPSKSGEAMLSAAEHAFNDATMHGAGTVRAFAPDMAKRAREKSALADELPDAIENEEIRPWFQPQVSIDSGAVTGFEVLARWEHPTRGIVPPAEFLDTADELGLMERLGEKMLYQALLALRAWDSAGVAVPAISVNFSVDELRNPLVVDKVRWELDRFGIAPDRLTVEVLETVIAQGSNDVVVRNLRAFRELGCRIDLDDFGTGHASITNIKRFSVGRIKIDRSFVTQLDTDSEQKTIVSAILTMAGRLGLETLAEGVETPGEHAALRALGCGFVQGFGIARPMPFAGVETWLADYRKRGRRATADGNVKEAPPAPGRMPGSPADAATRPAPAGKTA